MDTNKNGDFILYNDDLSNEKTCQYYSKRVKIKKVLLAIAVVTITSGAFAQINEPAGSKSQDIKNKNTLDNYNQNLDKCNHSDGYMMKNGKIMMIQNGQMTQLENDVTLSNGTTIGKDGSYLLKGGTKTMFKEGEHMDLMGIVVPMDKSKNYNKSQIDNPTRRDTMNWINDSIKNKPVEKLSPAK